MQKLKIVLTIFFSLGVLNSAYAQNEFLKPLKLETHTNPKKDSHILPLNYKTYADSTKKTGHPKFKAGGIFLNLGTGLGVPLKDFNDNSKPTFGILGRVEYASTAIFPFVIGAEIDYWSYIGDDQFKTLNLLSTFRTKITSFGLNIEYSLARLFNSPYSIPFITVDVKTNKIKREIDLGRTLEGLPAKDSKVSFGVGIGTTLFVFDFYLKYNFMKELSNFGAYAKMKFPIIRF